MCTLCPKSAAIDCGCLPTVEKRSRVVRLADGDLEKSARVAAVGGGQLNDMACPYVSSPDPIDAIL